MSTVRRFEPGTVVFLGAGPGDPELLTLRGKAVIEQADLIIYADSLVHPGISAFARRKAEIVGSSSRTLEEITELMIAAARHGKLVARVQSGDPSIYGAIHEQMALLERAGISYTVVPGVSSAFAAAAALKTELTVPDVSQTVIFTRLPSRTTMPEKERLSEIAAHGGTLVLFLSVTAIERVARELLSAEYPPDTPAAVVHRVTWDDELVLRGTLADIAPQARAHGLKKQALILVGAALGEQLGRGPATQRSSLYDGSYSHSFRPAKKHLSRVDG